MTYIENNMTACVNTLLNWFCVLERLLIHLCSLPVFAIGYEFKNIFIIYTFFLSSL